jgi:folate-binding Fe-S cluster repair protein YgfZ
LSPGAADCLTPPHEWKRRKEIKREVRKEKRMEEVRKEEDEERNEEREEKWEVDRIEGGKK